MKSITVFYHCRVRGGAHPKNEFAEANPPINGAHADAVMAEQMRALAQSGLIENASQFVVGCNGTEEECQPARALAGPKATFVAHGKDASGELPTLRLLEDWVKSHLDWVVLYHHSKGVCWPPPNDAFRRDWRRCLTWAVVCNWRRCVSDLQTGSYDMAGGHWLTPERFPGNAHLQEPIWGGNFFWAQASFLSQLPPLSRRLEWKSRWDAEHWVGHGRRPTVIDYCPHWPSPIDCANNADRISW